MKITVAMDSFKGSLTSLEAGYAVREGILRALPDAEVFVRPMADGGEGTVEALTQGLGGTYRELTVTGPAGRPVSCRYGILNDQKLAVMEMASAAGLTLVPEKERNPLFLTTFGVGEMILDAIHMGCRDFLIGIGGSATNDGGAGMLSALGYDLLDAAGNPIPLGAEGLSLLSSVSGGNVSPLLSQCRFQIACDVSNPLCGPSGASAVYGPQKGASPEMIRDMDRWLMNYAGLVQKSFHDADASLPGSGAAGGLGFAFQLLPNAFLKPGVSIVLETTRLKEWFRQSDLAVVGEGRLDGQTSMGKAPAGAASLAKEYGLPVLAFAGSVTPGAGACHQAGIDAFFPALRSIQTLEEAMQPENARNNLAAAAEEAFRLAAVFIKRGLPSARPEEPQKGDMTC